MLLYADALNLTTELFRALPGRLWWFRRRKKAMVRTARDADKTLSLLHYEARGLGEPDGQTVFGWVRANSKPDRIWISFLSLIIFVLDTVTDINIVIPILYVNVILLALRSGRREDVIAAGWGSIILTVVSFFITVNPNNILMSALINNALSLLAIVCVMLLCLRVFKSQTEVIRTRDRIAQVSRRIMMKTISAAMVHEMTQPIAAITTNADAAIRWLDQAPPNVEEIRGAASRIVTEVERTTNIIGRLRLLMGPGTISMEPCRLSYLIQSSLDHLRHDMNEAAVNVTISCPTELEIEADKVLIEQVLINLLSNAIDALNQTTDRERSVGIEARRGEAEVLISIADNGPGCAPETVDQMFDPFFTTKSKSGMGIGLAVSRSIVEAHSGTIRSRKNTPNGLVVDVSLPAAERVFR